MIDIFLYFCIFIFYGKDFGDQRVWGKHTLMDVSLRSTLIVRAPSACKAVKNYRIVSAVDIYPTLMELCNLSIPEGMDGHSFVELLENPIKVYGLMLHIAILIMVLVSEFLIID